MLIRGRRRALCRRRGDEAVALPDVVADDDALLETVADTDVVTDELAVADAVEVALVLADDVTVELCVVTLQSINVPALN